MSQRDSGYERKERDLYETPHWVTHALILHLPLPLWKIWEPACGSGKMADVLDGVAHTIGTDVHNGDDFLLMVGPEVGEIPDAIITNPPYELAQEFIERALWLMEDNAGCVAMLLRCDYDHAKSRTHLFRDCPAFAKKLVLMRRIKWFENTKGSPSFNHAWFIWDWKHDGPPTIGYGP